jgi:hypothetical protein
MAVLDTLGSVSPAAAEERPPTARKHWLWTALTWCLVIDLIVVALIGGLALRRYAWARTEPIRYGADISNAFRQGMLVSEVGFLDYDDAIYGSDGDPDGRPTDYAPGRLAVATLWTRWVRYHVESGTGPRPSKAWPNGFYAEARELGRQEELCAPLLRFNLFMEFAAAVGAFVLVRQWTAYRGRIGSAASGLVAATLLWFNPALIWDAHCWPQWDCWLLPFYLWALVAASAEEWFVAGCLIAVGAMFKTQILLVAPVLAFWPLFQGRGGATLRYLAGFACGVATCVAPWLVRVAGHTHAPAIGWVIGVALVAGVLATTRQWRLPRNRLARIGGMVAVALLIAFVIWPSLRFGMLASTVGVAITFVLILVYRLTPQRAGRYLVPTSVALSLFACVPLFGGSVAWFQAGVMAGARQLRGLPIPPCSNLPAMLAAQWQWHAMDPVFTVGAGRLADAVGSALAATDRGYAFSRGQDAPVPLRSVLIGCYVAMLLACGAATAWQARRHSPRFLVAAAVAPWVLTFTLLPQQRERYLIWGAALGATAAALSPGLALLDLLVTAIALIQVAGGMTRIAREAEPLNRLIVGFTPGIGWALLTAAVAYLYLAFSRNGRSSGLQASIRREFLEELPLVTAEHRASESTGVFLPQK